MGAIGSASQKRQRRDAAQPRAKTAERSEPWVGARKGKALKGRSRLLPRPCRAFWIFHCQPRVSAAAQPPPWAVLPRAFSAWHFDSHFQLHPPKIAFPVSRWVCRSRSHARVQSRIGNRKLAIGFTIYISNPIAGCAGPRISGEAASSESER
jgi:hypothetical protein